MKPIIALTMGDPGGIGPEIILKSLRKRSQNNSVFLVVGSERVFRYASRRLKLPFHPHLVSTVQRKALRARQIHFLDISPEAQAIYRKKFRTHTSQNGSFSIGKGSRWNAALAYAALKIAADLAHRKVIDAVVTAPLHKASIQQVSRTFTGHTEFLAAKEHVREFAMMFASKQLHVTLATIHLPLKKVTTALKTDGITAKIRLTDRYLKQYRHLRSPRIGVAALNPHGSEFGPEDDRIVRPAVRRAKRGGIRVTGPLSGDQIFHEALNGKFDAVIAMYHDQGLAPFKMIAFHEGVNVTLGLPYLRTSPDHGTAFDIAYRNKANPTAFRNSIRLVEEALR